MTVGTAMVMWARSFALFFEGVETSCCPGKQMTESGVVFSPVEQCQSHVDKDCPICYNVVELTTGSIPRKACPTCKKKATHGSHVRKN
eukprot:916683-Amphidinium_carterae.1